MPNHREEQADEPTDVPRLEELESPAGSPPQNVSMSHLMELQNCVSNLSLAHEIVVNQDFRFKSSSPPKDSLEGRVAEMVHRAFWDVLREQLESSPPDHRQAVPLLREVKTVSPAWSSATFTPQCHEASLPHASCVKCTL
ncbi:unnamed protein product [Boreogadus saida]